MLITESQLKNIILEEIKLTLLLEELGDMVNYIDAPKNASPNWKEEAKQELNALGAKRQLIDNYANKLAIEISEDPKFKDLVPQGLGVNITADDTKSLSSKKSNIQPDASRQTKQDRGQQVSTPPRLVIPRTQGRTDIPALPSKMSTKNKNFLQKFLDFFSLKRLEEDYQGKTAHQGLVGLIKQIIAGIALGIWSTKNQKYKDKQIPFPEASGDDTYGAPAYKQAIKDLVYEFYTDQKNILSKSDQSGVGGQEAVTVSVPDEEPKDEPTDVVSGVTDIKGAQPSFGPATVSVPAAATPEPEQTAAGSPRTPEEIKAQLDAAARIAKQKAKSGKKVVRRKLALANENASGKLLKVSLKRK